MSFLVYVHQAALLYSKFDLTNDLNKITKLFLSKEIIDRLISPTSLFAADTIE